ncbi:MAG: 50S ribosomal protein L29 [Acidobacteria bacterium]|nr:MAG: 50S ribosomal protein L29 [Acidobacteriota bacterium]
MKARELREKTHDELLDLETELAQQLFTLRLQKATSGQLENPAKIRQTRRDLARVLTVLREKRAGQAETAAAAAGGA